MDGSFLFCSGLAESPLFVVIVDTPPRASSVSTCCYWRWPDIGSSRSPLPEIETFLGELETLRRIASGVSCMQSCAASGQ